jgi:hypothetical protein
MSKSKKIIDQSATADKINNYNWILKDKIEDKLIGIVEKPRLVNRSVFDIWDPLELKAYVCE